MSHVQTEKKKWRTAGGTEPGCEPEPVSWGRRREWKKKGKKKLLKKCWLLNWNTPVNILWPFFFWKTKSIFPFEKKLAPRHFMKTLQRCRGGSDAAPFCLIIATVITRLHMLTHFSRSSRSVLHTNPMQPRRKSFRQCTFLNFLFAGTRFFPTQIGTNLFFFTQINFWFLCKSLEVREQLSDFLKFARKLNM